MCLQHTDSHGNLDLEGLRTAPETSLTMRTVIERMQHMLRGRRFFTMETFGPEMRTRDYVHLRPGART